MSYSDGIEHPSKNKNHSRRNGVNTQMKEAYNREINFSPIEEYFTKEQVEGVDKFIKNPIVDGIVRFVKAENSSGLLVYRSRLIKNPTWFDAMEIAIEQSRKTKDTHHVWLEDFEIVGFQYELAFGKVQRVTLVRLGLGS